MSKYYYNNETDTIESIDVIREDYYTLFGNEYDSFDDYLSACMTYNNGVLQDITSRRNRVKERLNQKLVLAQKYGMDEYIDEVTELLAEMDRLGKYIRNNQ